MASSNARPTRSLAVGVAIFILALPGIARSGEAEIEAHRRVSAELVESAQLDRLMLALAQSRLAGNEAFERNVDYVMFRLRPPALWSAKHPAWAPARATLIALARDETGRQVKEYWKSLHPLTIREAAGTFQPSEAEIVRDFAATPGGKAYFERRLTQARLKNGEALFELDPESPADLARHAQEARKRFDSLPADEKQRVDAFLAGGKCPRCRAPPAQVMEDFITRQVNWLVEVLTSMFASTDSEAVGAWMAGVDAKLHASLPVDSRKQLLGILEMRKDATLAFRFTFSWNNRTDGGTHTLEFPRGHPNYAEVLALSPGLSSGQSRPLYRDERGVIGDQP
jgi:hypothetical protein